MFYDFLWSDLDPEPDPDNLIGSGTGSGQFDWIRIRPKGSDPSGSGSATLEMGIQDDKKRYFSIITWYPFPRCLLHIRRGHTVQQYTYKQTAAVN